MRKTGAFLSVSTAVAVAVVWGVRTPSSPAGAGARAEPIPGNGGKACVTIVVGSQATADGSVLMSHEEDYAPTDAMKLEHHPRRTHAPGELIHFAFEDVAQVPLTYAYTADQMYDPQRLGMPPATFMNGINEWGVAMGSNCISTREPQLPNDVGLGWPEIGQLVMERATTAREAVELAGELVDRYTFNGFEVSDCKNLAFVISDPNEGWAMEVTRRHWVARRVPDAEAIYYANECRIGESWDLASADLVDYAVQQGWHEPDAGQPFSFKDVYCGPFLGEEWNVKRQERARALVEPKLGALTVADLTAVMRDHYEGTPGYAIPHTAGYAGPLTVSICNANNHASEVYHLRGWLPRELGPVMFLAATSPCISVYNPVYAGYAGQTPIEWRTAEASFDAASAWWNFESIQRTLAPTSPAPDAAFQAAHWPRVRAGFDRAEAVQRRLMPAVEAAAGRLIAEGRTEEARRLLSRFTNERLRRNYSNARAQLRWLAQQGGTPGDE